MSVDKKVLDLDQLAARAAELARQGKKVVQSHGVFDLLHVGHIRHLKEARSFGDVLVVTLTPDRFVNKGPHRPAFPEALRAEALAALADVDYVAVNRWPTAVEALKMIKPRFYAKGPDYRNAADDLTGKIKDEEATVKAAGGEIRFTEDITFSSSTLINRHLDLLSADVKSFMGSFRAQRTKEDVFGVLDNLKGLRVAVVGEAILDDYVYCDVLGKSSKEPVLAALRRRSELYAGGSLAIANHLADLCAEVRLVTYVGDRDAQEAFILSKLKPTVKPVLIPKKDSPTLVKRRYVEAYLLQKMFEVYDMNDALLAGADEEAFLAALRTALKGADLAIVADYGHGLMTPRAIDLCVKEAKFLAVNTQINAANLGYHAISNYPRADYICIHEGEMRLDQRSRQGEVRALVRELSRKMACPQVMVTQGKRGSLMYQREKDEFTECPAFANKVVDRIGSGDTVLGVTALLAAQGAPADMTSFLGNLAGAQSVLIIGNSSFLDRVQLLKSIESLMK